MKKALYFISWGIILPFVSLYLIFAFIMWDIWWPAYCDMFTRVIFIGILMFCLLGSTSIANDEIY